jgi:hypothetical protein
MKVSLPADHASSARRILLCGKSLFISGVQASLDKVPGINLQMVDARCELIREKILSWQPDVVILEAGEMKNASTFSLLQEFPQLKFVSLGIEDNRLLVFSGADSGEPTPEDLLQVIAR